MFCDYYNPSSRTYCKRLRVLCPEHSKDPKVNDTEVRRFLCMVLVQGQMKFVPQMNVDMKFDTLCYNQDNSNTKSESMVTL